MFEPKASLSLYFMFAFSIWCLVDVNNAVYIKGRHLPRVTEPVVPKSIVLENFDRNIEIPCRADGIPRPNITWFRNGEQIKSDDRRLKVLAHGALLVKSFTSDDNGYFWCNAASRLGMSISQKVHIQFLGSVNLGPRQSKKTLHVTLGRPMSLRCDSAVRVKMLTYTMVQHWYRNFDAVNLTQRVGMDTRGTLHFAHVTREDCETFYCRLGSNNYRVNQVEINVVQYKIICSEWQTSPKDQHAPALMHSVDLVKANWLETAILECYFAGKPAPTVQWYYPDGQPRNTGFGFAGTSYLRQSGKQLQIRVLRYISEGRYSCVGKNSLGSETKYIFLTISGPPKEKPSESPQLVRNVCPFATKEVYLYCDAITAPDEPLNTPKWYRNGIPIFSYNVPSVDRYIFDPNYRSLLIRNVVASDQANYQCNVSNSKGYLFFDGFLSFNDHKVLAITKKPPDRVQVVPGRVVDLSIEAMAPDCRHVAINWTRRGQPFYPEEWPVFQVNKRVVLFDPSRVTAMELFSYEGEYRCSVTDGVSVWSFSLYLEVQPHPAMIMGGCDGLAKPDVIMWVLAFVLTCLYQRIELH